MNWLDISTYIGNNLNSALVDFLIYMASLILFYLLSYMVIDLEFYGDDRRKKLNFLLRTTRKVYIFIFLFALTTGLFPTHEKVLAVKLSKIKNEIVTKDNFKKSADGLERIGKKLECKYLDEDCK